MPSSYHFDYFLKDHLGNVRSVITQQVDSADIYLAGMETDMRDFEVALFGDKISSTATLKPGGFDTGVQI